MKATDAMIELAEYRVQREAEASVAAIQSQLSGQSGRLVCDCGEPIPEARRLAVPHTTKCFECASRAELRTRRRA